MPQSLAAIFIHAVFSNKNRKKDLDAELRPRLFAYSAEVIKNKHAKAHIVNGGPEHVHILLSLPAALSLSDLLRIVKSNSSRWVHETFPNKRDFAWQAGYAAFSVSHSKFDDVFNYVRDQEQHHRRTPFEAELLSLLKRHELEYDERHLWS
jgi:REP element-mobilizing transposase RayT